MSGFTGTSEMRTARVAHVCRQCDRVITAGERYHHWTGVYDGTWFREKTCAQCDQFQTDLYAIDVRSEDGDGVECHPWLPELDVRDLAENPLMLLRYQRYRMQWDGQPYPTAETEGGPT